jgi:hypothetical protein
MVLCLKLVCMNETSAGLYHYGYGKSGFDLLSSLCDLRPAAGVARVVLVPSAYFTVQICDALRTTGTGVTLERASQNVIANSNVSDGSCKALVCSTIF